MGSVARYKKEIMTLGVKGEVVPFDFTSMGSEAAPLVEAIHNIAKEELFSRDVVSYFDWSGRAKNMFLRNKLFTVGSVMYLTLRQVDNLVMCGYKTRKEVYDQFKSIGILLPNWEPEKYWGLKMRVKQANLKGDTNMYNGDGAKVEYLGNGAMYD
jgi:hypothetical protein